MTLHHTLFTKLFLSLICEEMNRITYLLSQGLQVRRLEQPAVVVARVVSVEGLEEVVEVVVRRHRRQVPLQL